DRDSREVGAGGARVPRVQAAARQSRCLRRQRRRSSRPNIFNEVAKFKKRFEETKQKSATRESQEPETIRQSRTSAVHTIRSMSNRWYLRPFGPSAPATIVLASRLL
ncbi:unnamed protein product, partial [Urochloa humidicola]